MDGRTCTGVRTHARTHTHTHTHTHTMLTWLVGQLFDWLFLGFTAYHSRICAFSSMFLQHAWRHNLTLPAVSQKGSLRSKLMAGLGTILLISWLQCDGTEPRNWTKELKRPEVRDDTPESWTICSVSTSLATSPCNSAIHFNDPFFSTPPRLKYWAPQ
jgi:hypothetical protein